MEDFLQVIWQFCMFGTPPKSLEKNNRGTRLHSHARQRHVRRFACEVSVEVLSEHTDLTNCTVVCIDRGSVRLHTRARHRRVVSATLQLRRTTSRSRARVMGAAPLPGDAEALALGRSLPRVGNGVNNHVKTLAELINVHTRTRNERLPVSPTRRGKHKMKQSESMVFDLLFDSIDGGAEDMDDILGEETQHDSDSDNEQHDPVSVYVRYVGYPTAKSKRSTRFFPRRLERYPRLD